MGNMAFMANAVQRSISSWIGLRAATPKHDHYKDFGWPEDVQFSQFRRMYQRNALAGAVIDKTIAKTWETVPKIWETDKPLNTEAERKIEKQFRKIGAWRALMTADQRSMVGAYAGVILYFADDQPLREPAGRMSDITQLVGMQPFWQDQLRPTRYVEDERSADYGMPAMYAYSEVSKAGSKKTRNIDIHPSRVVIFSDDGTLDCESFLQRPFNDLIDAEKIKGAGAEGLWKNSRGAPIIEAPDGLTPQAVAKMMGTEPDKLMDKMNDQLDQFQGGFDKGLMLGGMTAKPMSLTLTNPEPFFNIAAQNVAAHAIMAIRILIGNQTGERASTEDSREWNKTCSRRRENRIIPILQNMLNRFADLGLIPAIDWYIGWDDLTEATAGEKIDRAAKLAEINAKTPAGDDAPFTPDEIREAAGFELPDAGDEDTGDGDDLEDEAMTDDGENDNVDPADETKAQNEKGSAK